MNQASPAVSAWYRQPIVWLMFILTMAAVIASISTFFIAKATKDSMVVEDYYKQGKAINQVLQRENRAIELGLRFAVTVSQQQINVEFVDGQLSTVPALILSLYHPTLANNDRTLPLRQVGDGRFVADLAQPLTGRWDFNLEPAGAEWRIKQSVALPRADAFMLGK